MPWQWSHGYSLVEMPLAGGGRYWILGPQTSECGKYLLQASTLVAPATCPHGPPPYPNISLCSENNCLRVASCIFSGIDLTVLLERNFFLPQRKNLRPFHNVEILAKQEQIKCSVLGAHFICSERLKRWEEEEGERDLFIILGILGERKWSCQYNKSHRQFQPPSGAKGAARAYVLKKAMKSVGDSLLAWCHQRGHESAETIILLHCIVFISRHFFFY